MHSSDMGIGTTGRWQTGLLAFAASIWMAASSVAAPGDNFFVWNWGSDADIDASKVPSIAPADRIGSTGTDGDIKFRFVKPTYQVMLTMPAFDFDATNHGALNHPFFLTFKFKDVAKTPITVCAAKGGCGFYGAGFVGTFGGAGDGKWKEETIIIRRSMMRCVDGKTFVLKFTETRVDVPVASLTLFSADSKLPGVKDRVAEAIRFEADRRDALRARLLPGFKDLGLPEPGKAPDYTAGEKERGFRVFFPPVSRQLFANSQPQEGELTGDVRAYACPGQHVTLVAAIRGLKELGKATVTLSDLNAALPGMGGQSLPAPVNSSQAPWRWAVYSEQRIGSSWGKDYRVCPEQLVLGASRDVKPDRLEIACAAFKVADAQAAGRYAGKLTVTTEKGGSVSTPVTLVVYPFKLERPEHSTHGQFYYVDYADINPFEAADMAEHGMDTLVSGLGAPVAPGPDGKRATEQTRKAFSALKSLGYRAPLIDNNGYMNTLLKEGKRPVYSEVVAETLSLAKAAGFDEMGFFPVDEPHTPELQQLALKACTWIKDTPGANTYITSNPKAVPVLDTVLNYVCYNLTYLNEQTIHSMKPHQKLMFYCPSIDVNPEYNRYRPGFYAFKINAFSSQYFAYMEFAADPFCDLDGPNRDWNVVYPSLESPSHDPTLEWEAMREGVVDFRYAWTLKAAAERARREGRAEAADRALKVLDDVLAQVDVDGNKAGGPAISIEADVRLKDKKLDSKELTEAKSLIGAAWYDASRRRIADAIISLAPPR